MRTVVASYFRRLLLRRSIKRAGLLLLFILALALIAYSPLYSFRLINLLCIYTLLLCSLNLVVGLGGLLTFNQAIYYGIGAYAYALARYGLGNPTDTGQVILSGRMGFLSATVVGIACAMTGATALGAVILRFRKDQLILVTVVTQCLFVVLMRNISKVTRGADGIYNIPRPSIFGWSVVHPGEYTLLFLVAVSSALGLLWILYRSPFGLALKSLRDDERAAASLGIRGNRTYLWALALSGGCAGLAGSLYAAYVTFIDPSVFSIDESVLLVMLLLIGGVGTFRGPLLGAMVCVLLPELCRQIGLPNAQAANLRQIIYGALLIALMYWRPQGLAGNFRIR